VPDLIFREEAGVLKSRRQQRRHETLAGLAMIVMAMVGLTGMMLWVFDVFILWGIARLTHLG